MPVSIKGCRAEHETAKALLVKLPDEEKPVWIPKSCITDDSEVFNDKENSTGILVITDWFAEKQGIS